MPQNSPVMIDDVTVGSVSGVDAVQRPDGTFYAAVKLSLDGNVNLPANSTAKVAQTSLLGSQHIDLVRPPAGQPQVGQLQNGSTIPLADGSRFPTTEEVLSSLGVVVNKGNLGALQDITDEAYAAVAGRAGDFVDLIPRLAEFTDELNQQTNDIIATAEGLNRVAATLAAQQRQPEPRPRFAACRGEGAQRQPQQHRRRVRGAAKLREGGVAHPVRDQEDIAADFKDLYAVIKPLNDNARTSCRTSICCRPSRSPRRYLRRAVRGDYLNVFVTFDLTIRRLGETIFTTSYFDPNMQHLNEVINPPDWLVGSFANLIGQAADPFKIPPGTASGQEVPPS